ncbi:BrnA antitoxin family protein [Sphingomonas sp. MMS24-JH45]
MPGVRGSRWSAARHQLSPRARKGDASLWHLRFCRRSCSTTTTRNGRTRISPARARPPRFFPGGRGGFRQGADRDPFLPEEVSLPIDRDVLARFRAQGPDWQSRMNAALRAAAGL